MSDETSEPDLTGIAAPAESALTGEIRRRRRLAGLSHAEFAVLIGYSRQYVSRAERPRKGLASADLVRAIDTALDAGGALTELHAHALVERQARRARPASPGKSAGRKLDDDRAGEPDRPAPVRVGSGDAPSATDQSLRAESGRPRPLRPLIDQVMTRSLGADYDHLNGLLPDLLGRAEFEALHSRDRERAHAALADVYSVIGWVLIKADAPLIAWIAAERAVQAAEQAHDAIRVAAAMRCVAEVHMRNGNHEKATRTALVAALGLERRAGVRDTPLAVSVRGAALLSAAAASARQGERREAYASLNAAAQCADEIGQESFELATVFGPTNVAIHRVAIPIELGDAREALRQERTVQLDQLPGFLTERKARFLLDVARAHTAVSDFSTAQNVLIGAEKIAAEEVHRHRITRQLIPQLLVHDHRGSAIRRLAGLCGIPV